MVVAQAQDRIHGRWKRGEELIWLELDLRLCKCVLSVPASLSSARGQLRWRADLADPGAVGKDEPRIEGCAIEACSGIRSFDFYAGITWARCLQADRLDPPTRGAIVSAKSSSKAFAIKLTF